MLIFVSKIIKMGGVILIKQFLIKDKSLQEDIEVIRANYRSVKLVKVVSASLKIIITDQKILVLFRK